MTLLNDLCHNLVFRWSGNQLVTGGDMDGSTQRRSVRPWRAVIYRPNAERPDEDEVYEFPEDGRRLTFGRGEDVDIVIWPAIRDRALSSVAGEIWRMDGQLWVRNLSRKHGLAVVEDGQLPFQLRRHHEGVMPSACAIPDPLARILAPGGCELEVHQLGDAPSELVPRGDSLTVTRVPPVPDDLRLLAAALCEPIIRDGALMPASHKAAARRLGVTAASIKPIRRDVSRLTEYYLQAAPELGARQRRRLEDQEAPPALRPVSRGVRPLQAAAPRGPKESTVVVPDHFEVAHLLVREHLITKEDLALLDGHDAHDERGAAGAPGDDPAQRP